MVLGGRSRLGGRLGVPSSLAVGACGGPWALRLGLGALRRSWRLMLESVVGMVAGG